MRITTGGQNIERRKLLALVHMGTSALFGADKDMHASYLFQHTGCHSCTQLNDPELARVAAILQDSGALPARRISDRPTDKQFKKLYALVKKRGWDNLKDQRLLSFIKRTLKRPIAASNLNRSEISRVITGLQRWKA